MRLLTSGDQFFPFEVNLYFDSFSQFSPAALIKVRLVEIQNCIYDFALKDFLADGVHLADISSFCDITAAGIIVSSYTRPI